MTYQCRVPINARIKKIKKRHFIFTYHEAHMELFYPMFLKLANLAFRNILLVYISIYYIHGFWFIDTHTFPFLLVFLKSLSLFLFLALSSQSRKPTSTINIYSYPIDPPSKKQTKKQKKSCHFSLKSQPCSLLSLKNHIFTSFLITALILCHFACSKGHQIYKQWRIPFHAPTLLFPMDLPPLKDL